MRGREVHEEVQESLETHTDTNLPCEASKGDRDLLLFGVDGEWG
jgi:hypothetical protein